MKHTKGEWKAEGRDSQFEVDILANGKRICTVKSFPNDAFNDPSEKQADANAKLIAAAPLMFKDIEAYVFRIDEWIEMLKNGAKNTEVINQLNDFKDFSKELIKKATE